MSVVVIGLCLLAFINNVSAQKRKLQTETSPLVLRVTAPTTTICRGAKNILLKAIMSNMGDQPVTIDKYFLWNNSISVTFENKTGGSGEWTSGGDIHGAGDFLELAPEQKYVESYKFSISNGLTRDFFRRAGRYILRINYEAVNLNNQPLEVRERLYTKPVISNQIAFRIINCR